MGAEDADEESAKMWLRGNAKLPLGGHSAHWRAKTAWP
jgi:hypothetical protein